MSDTIQAHPFEKTLGAGPYRFVGFFSINIRRGQQGGSYVNPDEMHPKFKFGAGTCAHCGQGILNVFQIEIGNGDVYGVGSDCIAKVGLPPKVMSQVEKAAREHAKAKRKALKAKKGDAARSELKALIETQADQLKAKPHPSPAMGHLTLLEYAQWVLEHSNDGGIVFALGRVKFALKEGN